MGAIPDAIDTWPLGYSELRASAVLGGVQTMINGVPTIAGWLNFFAGVAFYGAFGVASAVGFWLVWRKNPNTLSNPDGQTRIGI
jgi:hypothetical protein